MRINADKKKIEWIEESIREIDEIIMSLRDSDNIVDQIAKREAQDIRDCLQKEWIKETGESWYDFGPDELYD